MACNSEYMAATNFEIEISRVASLLDELAGSPIDPNHWRGYHPAVYADKLSKAEADEMVKTLCSKCQTIDPKQYSLELQIWWRDHQEADARRLRREIARAENDAARAVALEKLTPFERKLLGLTAKEEQT